ncbi:von Willebrand factor C and EGF domain-containing protein-like isoform X2 [Periplaneta americana]|uniref:von Willebrand factor C and EGF domain-containing protein-like isoform X2 n=1 Tax=Periplaneta americana TaxID=6978 RepID=UPI0037E9625D
MKLSILVAVIIIRYMVTECHLIPRSERLWIKQTIPIAQDKFKNILIKKPHMQGKHSSFEEDRYFHDKQDLEMIKPVIENEATSKKSFSERHRFLATHVWKVQHRWPLVYRAKRSSQAVPVKSYERNEILVESESGKFSQQKGESFEEFLLHQVSNNSQGNNTETLNNIISNTTDVEKPEHCNTDCVETKLQFDESGNFNCGANCTSAEDMTTYDLEMSDQPHGGQGVGSDCTTDCGVIKEAETLCHTCHQVCHYVPDSRRVKCGCYHGYAIGPDWLHCIDIDECSVNNSWLCHGGTCMNTVGSFMCRCRPGYQLVGHMCMDVDECTQNKGTVGMCDQVCINVPDVNECSRVPSLCNYVCVNTFGSYQCLCPSGYTISGDRKSCIIHTSPVVETASINNRNKYNAVIEVLVSPNRMTADHGAHKITPTLIESSFTSEIGSLRTRLHNPAYPPNKLAIENLHTMAYSGPNLLSQVDSLFSSEQIPNEVQPTYVLYKDEETYPSSYMEPTAFLSTKVEDIVKSSEYIFGSPFTTSVTQLNSTPTLKDELGMETVPNLIVRSDVPESSISVFQQIVITPTHTGMLVTPFSTVPANITMDHSQEDLSGEKDPSKDAKKDNKGKGKKTKKLSHKDEKQKPRKDKDKKMRNKTLKKGRIKFVRLTTDFQVLNQILDASREAWRDGGTRLPVGKPRAETNWNMGTLAGGNTASGLGDRYFEVIDYDDDYFDEPLRKTYNNSDPFAVPVTVPSILSTDLTVLPRHWNLTGKPEQDCYHGDKKIKSRTTLYRDEKNCTKCICKDGELRCKPHHCPTPHCEAPLHGRCCDYCPDDCLVSDDVYHPGERFVPAVDVCRECRCVAGRAVCENIHCPALDCPEQFQVIVPEECCPVCTPPEPGCFYKGRFFYQGQLWVRKEGRCQACLCKDGAVQCNPVVCVVNCQHPQFVPGECCPLCDGCQHYNRKYNDQEMFPHPSDPCSICQCQHGNITCYPKPCNIACSHPYRPSGDCCPTCRHCYFSDRKISNGASLVINNGTCQECTCKQGNVTCKPAACAAPCMIRGKPIPSGAEFHIGSDTCTQCRCWNGTVSCHAVECETTCSHGVLLPHRCCLDCTKCDYEGQLYSEMQVFRPSGDTCKSCLCVKGIVMCQETCSSTPPKH